MRCIGIDCRFASSHSGLGRYTRELVSHLLLRRDPYHYVLFTAGDSAEWIPKDYGSSFTLRPVRFPHYSFSEQVRFPGIIKAANVELLFSPHFNVPLGCPVPTVVTIHDMILHRYPNDASFIKQLAYRLLFRQAVTRAEHVITVSEFTAKELASFYGTRATKKLTVIHESVSPHFAPRSADDCKAVLEKYGITRPFFLYVGNAKEHKNVQMLIEAFAALHNPDQELVMVTGGSEADLLTLRAGVRLLRSVPEQELPALYSSALCFVSASLYEGFGLPLLESHACGCPAIVTNRSAFPEIAPKGTVLVEPSVQAFTDALRTPPTFRPSERQHSWNDAAASTVEVFRTALRGV